jgi:Glycosyl hydrolase family 1
MTSGRYHRDNATRGPVIASATNVPITTGRFHSSTAALAAVRACGRCSAAMLIMPRRGVLAAALSLFASGSVVRSSPAAADDGAFPADFVWGASTSSYQIEGAVALVIAVLSQVT